MGKKGRLAGSSSTFFVVVVVCLFVFCGLLRDHLGIELNFQTASFPIKEIKKLEKVVARGAGKEVRAKLSILSQEGLGLSLHAFDCSWCS